MLYKEIEVQNRNNQKVEQKLKTIIGEQQSNWLL
jgi:hypothetical protein